MPKNIVICCDGTGNSFENPDNDSNVMKLYSTLLIDGATQVGYSTRVWELLVILRHAIGSVEIGPR
jgi:hypothetical protein